MTRKSVQINRRSFLSFKDELEPVLDISKSGSVDSHEIVSEIVGDEIAVYHEDRANGTVSIVNVSTQSAVEAYVRNLADENGWDTDSYACVFDKFGIIRDKADG